MKSGVLSEPVLVGREHELEELQAFLISANGGKGSTVFISSEAGAGKTRLVTTFLQKAKSQGMTILSGCCLANVAVPYFPFFEAFTEYFSEHFLDKRSEGHKYERPQLGESKLELIKEKRTLETEDIDIMSLLMSTANPQHIVEPGTNSPQIWKDQTFAAVIKSLAAISKEKTTILFIDDIHWADSASLALLHYIARRIGTKSILVLATFRSEQLTSDTTGRSNPLVETLRLMKREDLFKEIKISNLNRKDVSQLAENMLGGALQQEFCAQLEEESQGNPLFIVESLRMLVERDGLIKEKGKWRLVHDKIGIPDKIRDIILQRLSNLTNEQRKVLSAASVMGNRFDAELVASVLNLELLSVIEILDTIGRTTALLSCDGEKYQFDHAKSRDTVYGEVSLIQKRVYHSIIAGKLEGKNGILPFSDLAYHYAQAGNKDKAIKYALAAGQDALARWSNSQAIEHFEYVLKNATEGSSVEKVNALEGLAEAYAANSMYAEAIKKFDELIVSETGIVRLRAIRKAMSTAFLKGDKPQLLFEYAKKAEEVGSSEGESVRLEMARVLNKYFLFAFLYDTRATGYDPDTPLDLALYDAALQIFEEENSLADVADALWRSGVVCTAFEDLREKGLSQLLRSVAVFKEIGDMRKEVEATLWTGVGYAFCGLFPEARREYASVLTIGEKLDAFAELVQAQALTSEISLFDGNLVDSLSRSLKALEYCKKTDANLRGLVYSLIALLYCMLADLENADEYFNRLNELPPEALANVLVSFIVGISRGVYFAAKSRWEEANQAFESLLEFFKPLMGANLLEMLFMRSYAWALDKQGRYEEAGVQMDGIEKVIHLSEERFGHPNVQLSLMLPREFQVGEEIEMRLDIVNVGRKPGTLVKINGIVFSEFAFTNLPSFCVLQEGNLAIKGKSVGPFQVETVKLKLKVVKAGTYNLSPEIDFIDDLQNTKKFNANQITVTAKPAQPVAEIFPGSTSGSRAGPSEFEFRTSAAAKTFDFLETSFAHDYMRRRIPLERSGWRSLNEIVKHARISAREVYGSNGHAGQAIRELEHRGLIEVRIFPGERGRGGNISKARISYEKETVRRNVDERIMKTGKNR